MTDVARYLAIKNLGDPFDNRLRDFLIASENSITVKTTFYMTLIKTLIDSTSRSPEMSAINARHTENIDQLAVYGGGFQEIINEAHLSSDRLEVLLMDDWFEKNQVIRLMDWIRFVPMSEFVAPNFTGY